MKGKAIALAAVLLVGCGECGEKPVIESVSPVPTEVGSVSVDKKDKITEVQELESGYTPISFEQQRAVWLSYIELAQMLALDEEGFCESVGEAFDEVAELGCNTVYVHVRSHADACYDSQLFVVSRYCTGGEYDPLEIMVSEAHERGLAIHAWVNPLRCDDEEGMERMEGTEIYEWYKNMDSYDEYLVECDGVYWLNPGRSEVRALIAEGAREIAIGYEVDGINIDDYFYPTTDVEFYERTYAREGGGLTLEQWRLDSCSQMVAQMYEAIKSVDERILFGVSPQGNLENNYTYMYADVERWCCEEGYLDYIVPQIYFGYENESCPFLETLEEWAEIVTNDDVSLICGIGVYKLYEDEEFMEDEGIIERQIKDALELCDGYALYD